MTKKDFMMVKIILAIISVVVIGLGGSVLAGGIWIGKADEMHTNFKMGMSNNKSEISDVSKKVSWIKGALEARGFKPVGD